MHLMSLNSNDASLDIIKAVDLLHTRTSRSANSYDNPVSGLITPEWHYSDSFQVLSNVRISWENLEESALIKTMTDSSEKTTIRKRALGGIEFERSFCSWYQPYHYLPREKWGVHLRYDSWMKVASLFCQSCPSLVGRNHDCIKSAFFYLYV